MKRVLDRSKKQRFGLKKQRSARMAGFHRNSGCLASGLVFVSRFDPGRAQNTKETQGFISIYAIPGALLGTQNIKMTRKHKVL